MGAIDLSAGSTVKWVSQQENLAKSDSVAVCKADKAVAFLAEVKISAKRVNFCG